jgi:hypothetical protein
LNKGEEEPENPKTEHKFTAASIQTGEVFLLSEESYFIKLPAQMFPESEHLASGQMFKITIERSVKSE